MPNSPLASVKATRELLDSFGLSAKYRLGQNFLVDDTVVGRILDLAKLEPSDAVLEVGPGIGTLTSAMLPRAGCVVAVEADGDLALPLAQSTGDYSERFALIVADALTVEPSNIRGALEQLALRGNAAVPDSRMPGKWVSNLPYAVAATLILQYFQEWDFIHDACVMVQSEVADRIAANPGTKTYGAYTVKLALYARTAQRFEVPPSSFYPAPHVSSAVIRLERRQAGELCEAQEARSVCKVVEAAFAQRRKTIRNSMGSQKGFDRNMLDEAYASCGISPACRAETLDPHAFVELARTLCRLGWDPGLADAGASSL